MANTYYVFSPAFVPGQKVRSDEVNLQYAAIETAFDLMPGDNSAIGRGTTYLGVESGTANALEVTLPDPRTSYGDGDQVLFKGTNTNTGPATIDIDGLGAVSLVSAGGTALGAGEIEAGLYYTAIFDLTNNRWQIIGASAAALTAADDRVTWASEWATEVEDTLISVAAGGDGATDYSALHWAAKAAANAGAASTAQTNAETAQANAETAESNAAASAASINLPAIGGSDVADLVRVNAGKTGYEFYNIFADANNTWETDQTFTTLIIPRRDSDVSDAPAIWFGDTIADGGAIRWQQGCQGVTHNMIFKSGGSTIVEFATAAAPLKTTSTQLLFNGIDVQRAATTTTTGLVERATDAEVVTGTDTTRYVAPLEIATNYYNKLTGDVLKINNTASYTSVFDAGNSGASKEIDWTNGNKQNIDITASTTFTFVDPDGPTSLTLELRQGASNGYTVTWPSTVDWADGVAPTFNTGTFDYHLVTLYYNGSRYYGHYGLNYF